MGLEHEGRQICVLIDKLLQQQEIVVKPIPSYIKKVKGLSAATENFGNFFAQNCFPASSGVVLIQSGLAVAGYDVTLSDIASSAIFVMVISVILTIIQVLLFDRKIKGGKNS